MDVSKNNGTPKSSILIGFSIINHPFWSTTIFGNTHMVLFLLWCIDGDQSPPWFLDCEVFAHSKHLRTRSFRRCRSHRMLESSCNLFEYTKNGFPNTGGQQVQKKRGDGVTNLGKRTLFGESFRVPSRPSERMGFSPSRLLFSLRSGIYKSTIPCGY